MDQYILGQSKIAGITDEHPEIVLNLNLKKNTYYDNALIYGNVLTSNECPIEDATISFFNENDEKIGSVYSSEEGFYAYFEVKLNTKVKIIAKKIGYKTKISDFMKICSRMINFNIYLKKSHMSKYTLISGHLVDNNNKPLKDITVYLLKNTCSNEKRVYKATTTNIYGQFVFSDIPRDIYEIFINNPNFEIYNKLIEIKQTDKIFDINIKLNKKDIKTKITGQIKDDNDIPIPNALVILYRVDDNKFIPIAHTVCNEKGIYCFTNIPFDNYIVKAKL
ncbi:carboxypeptidase regulatory-like domain-containing protein [Crassaminicella thermophila]|uniref:Carboxypeptidase regulatory-like domain-containing protein n=1 Tax=Crassaminicella thermophila TaxID=2599308 RepID=A0A5C0SFL6_CRATE|nr:carboxypeptidase-like regulatory domain-containing protein [Crassaminicella thermophila]QEK13000.1 carboxypeptidase regulatory-like domain-containing protein [Crassaminicella thermophila]